MFKELLSLLELRGCVLDIPVDMVKLHECVLEELTVYDMLSVCDVSDFTRCVEKCYSNFNYLCRVYCDVCGDLEGMTIQLYCLEKTLKNFLLNYITSPSHASVSKLMMAYLEIESRLL